MVSGVQVSAQSDVPIYRQIVAQLTFMIESGDLRPGHVLPSARLLADNLHINRNTVSRAYAELGELGLVEGRGRTGTVVTDAVPAGAGSAVREKARELLRSAVCRSVALGLSAGEINALVAGLAQQAEAAKLQVCFVECNADRAEYFARELKAHLDVPVTPLVLHDFEPATVPADLVLTTFYHLAEVRALMRRPGTDVVGIVAAPHVLTLTEIAAVPKHRKVGIRYSTDEQAAGIRDSLSDSGLANIVVLEGTGEADLAGVDLVVIPSETPELKAELEGRVKIIEYGNVLDAASVRMVSAVVRDMQAAKDGG